MVESCSEGHRVENKEGLAVCLPRTVGLRIEVNMKFLMPSFVVFGLLPSPSCETYSSGNLVFSLEVESVLGCVTCYHCCY